MIFGFLKRRRLQRLERQRLESLPHNRGHDYERAVWIIQRGMASGHHQIDKLTPDGLLCGYAASDFSPDTELTYSVQVDPEHARALLEKTEAPPFSDAPRDMANPDISDGFVLEVIWLAHGEEQTIRMANVEHKGLFAFVREVWSHVPAEMGRSLPSFPG